MRSGVTVIITFLCCIIGLVAVLTVGSFNLQKNEIEKAMDFTAKQVIRHCAEEGIEDKGEIHATLANTFSSQINSKNGNLTLYVLYADKDITDIAVRFSYTQFNGSEKVISCRKTYIRDWEEDKEEESVLRFISEKYAYETPENGGLKEDSVWRSGNVLNTIFNNKQLADGTWEKCEEVFEVKIEQ